MKVYEVSGSTYESIQGSLMFTFVNAWSCYLNDDIKMTIHWLEGALHYLDLITKEAGSEYYYPKINSL